MLGFFCFCGACRMFHGFSHPHTKTVHLPRREQSVRLHFKISRCMSWLCHSEFDRFWIQLFQIQPQ